MTRILSLSLITYLLPVVTSQFWNINFVGFSCGWRFGGQCSSSCDTGDYVFGTRPCGFGILGTCCVPALPCSAYGGSCVDGGCNMMVAGALEYRVVCPSATQTCCLPRAKKVSASVTKFPNSITQSPVQNRCSSSSNIIPRILGGSAVNSPSQWPWMVSIKLGTPESPGPHICAGVLVSDTKVLTTAACAQGDIFVTIGEGDLLIQDEPNEMNVVVTNKVTHSLYSAFDRSVSANDIAILTLAESVSGASAQPVCLADIGTDPTDRSCYIAGWGVNDLSQPFGSRPLHEGQVTVFPNQQCRVFGTFRSILQLTNLPSDKFCSALDVDACTGDNGGMLVCEDSPGTWNLYGVISDNGCGRNLPIIYTDISSHLAWIENNL